MNTSIAWMMLVTAGLLEPAWVYLLARSDGLKSFNIPVAVLVIALEFSFFSIASRYLPTTMAYGIWVSVGAIGVFLLSWNCFGETINWFKAISLFLIISGVVGLKYSA